MNSPTANVQGPLSLAENIAVLSTLDFGLWTLDSKR